MNRELSIMQSKYRQGLIRCEDKTGVNSTYYWRFAKDCVEIGEFILGGHSFPIGYPKIEFVMDHFGPENVTEMLRERVKVETVGELVKMVSDKRRTDAYKEVLDELFAIAISEKPQNKTGAFDARAKRFESVEGI